MLNEIFNEGENYFQIYLDDVLKLRKDRLDKGQEFSVVDKDIQDNAYNALIKDYIDEYNQKKSTIEGEIRQVEQNINKINSEFNVRIKKLSSGEGSNMPDVTHVKKTLESNKNKLATLERNLEDIFRIFTSFKNNLSLGVTHSGNLQEELMSSVNDYKTNLDILLKSNNQELKTYIEKRTLDFHLECNKFTDLLLKQVEEYKASIIKSLDEYRDKKLKEFDEIYNIDSFVKHGATIEEKATKIQLIKEKIRLLREKISGGDGKTFIKNISWIVLLLVVSLYDFVFLNKIFVDIFDVEGGDPQGLKNLLFGIISWVNLLSGGVLLLLIFIYTMGSVIYDKGNKIEAIFIKLLSILIILSLVVFSVVDVKLGKNGNIIYNFIQVDGVFIEFILRLLMLPVLLVGDFILLKMIVWQDFYLGQVLFKVFFSPFYLLYYIFQLFVNFFSYLTLGLVIEKKRTKLIELRAQNEQKIIQIIKPEIFFDIDLSCILVNDKVVEPFNGQFISTNPLLETLPNLTTGIENSAVELSKLTDVIKSINTEMGDKINSHGAMIDSEKQDITKKIEQLKLEQSNFLHGYMDMRNKLIENLKSSNASLKEIQSSLKKGITSGFKKYILVNK